MTLADWKRIEVCTPVEVRVHDESFVGNVLSSTRLHLSVIGEHETRTYDWPRLDRVLDDTTRLIWFNDRWFKCTLTIRKESRS